MQVQTDICQGSEWTKGLGKSNNFYESKHTVLVIQKDSKLNLFYEMPLFSSNVAAGFPSLVDDHIEKHIDLNNYLIKNPSSTFLLKCIGDSMKDAGIQAGDLLIVDRSLEPTHGRVVIAAVGKNLTVKRLFNKDGKVMLLPENPKFQPIEIDQEQNLNIWGVVIYSIHRAY